MDCETFKSALTGASYGELDGATGDAARRHLADCARCASVLERVRRMRHAALVSPAFTASDPGASLLGAAKPCGDAVLLRQRTARMVSLAGRWAMRPQSAMVAVFFVMLATSVLLLRGKSARTPASAEVIVTERGTPAPAPSVTAASMTATPSEPDSPSGVVRDRIPTSAEVRQPGTVGSEWFAHPLAAKIGTAAALRDTGALPFRSPALPPPSASPTAEATRAIRERNAAPAATETAEYERSADGAPSPFDAALANYRAARYDEATRAFEALVPLDTTAALWAARSIREGKGCRAAIGRFDRLAQQARQTPPGWDALLEGGLCYRALNELGNARARLNALLSVDSHKDRATAELDRIDQTQGARGARPLDTKGASKARSPADAAAIEAPR